MPLSFGVVFFIGGFMTAFIDVSLAPSGYVTLIQMQMVVSALLIAALHGMVVLRLRAAAAR